MTQNQPTLEEQLLRARRLEWLEQFVAILDDKYRVPGINVRFGLDPVLGLVPGLGDAVGYVISGFLILIMARHGASGMVVIRMLGNAFLDMLLGMVPLLGIFFDVAFRSNRRNLRLLQEHYNEGRHQGSGWWVIGMILAFLIAGLILAVFLIFKSLQWLMG